MSNMSWWGRFWAGMLIGAAGMAPGVSGGVVAVSLGLYQPAVEALSGLVRHGRRSAAFLAPLALGVSAGLAIAGYALMAFFDRFAAEAVYLFAGLVLGSLPALMRQGGKRRGRSLLLGLAGAAAYAAMGLMLPAAVQADSLTLPQALLCGAVLAVGTVVPGVSSSFLLIRLGLYGAYLAALGGLRLMQVGAVAAAFAAVAAVLVRVADRVLSRCAAQAHPLLAGFTLLSVVDALPPVSSALSPAACLMLLPLGAGLGLLLRGADTPPPEIKTAPHNRI